MPPKCSIVIRAYNEEKHLGKLLKGITEQVYQDYEIILVDSGSTDHTLNVAAKYPVSVVHIRPETFTFGRSLNMGIEAAQGEFVVIISAHCYPVNEMWLENLLRPLDNDAVAVSYGKQRGGETNQYSEHQWFKNYFPDESVAQQGHPYCHNANAAIRRSLWKQQKYNEQLTGLEDLAWGSWAMAEGHTISYAADAEIIHLHDEGIMTVYNRYKREAMAMKQILPESRFTLRHFAGLVVRKTLSDLGQALKEGVLIKEFVNVKWFRLAQYLGTYQGYRYSGTVDMQLIQQFYYPPGVLSEKSSDASDTYQSEIEGE